MLTATPYRFGEHWRIRVEAIGGRESYTLPASYSTHTDAQSAGEELQNVLAQPLRLVIRQVRREGRRALYWGCGIALVVGMILDAVAIWFLDLCA